MIQNSTNPNLTPLNSKIWNSKHSNCLTALIFIVLLSFLFILFSEQVMARDAVKPAGQVISSDDMDQAAEAEDAFDDEFADDIFQDEDSQASESHFTVSDPIEGLNRVVFTFNDYLYLYGLKPFSKVYVKVVPTIARRSVKNFFTNLAFPIRFVNDLLQGKGEDAAMEFASFFINSTLGFGGLNDFAQKYVGIRLQDEDFGQTLGAYGIGNGFYLVLPVLGPSSLRDTVGRAGDWFINPINYIEPWELSWAVSGYEKVNWTSFHMEDYKAFKKMSLDPYTAMRNFYIQNRNALIKDAVGAKKIKNTE